MNPRFFLILHVQVLHQLYATKSNLLVFSMALLKQCYIAIYCSVTCMLGSVFWSWVWKLPLEEATVWFLKVLYSICGPFCEVK